MSNTQANRARHLWHEAPLPTKATNIRKYLAFSSLVVTVTMILMDRAECVKHIAISQKCGFKPAISVPLLRINYSTSYVVRKKAALGLLVSYLVLDG